MNLKPSDNENEDKLYQDLILKLIEFKEEQFSELKARAITHNIELVASIEHEAQSSSQSV